MAAVPAAKEKTVSDGEPLPQAQTRVWGLPLENANAAEARWPATSTLAWGWRQSYAGTASDSLDQRYYNFGVGRFRTPDPGGLAAVDLKDPTSWNMYAYVGDDPVNFKDAWGLDRQAADDESDPSYCDENPVGLGCVLPTQRGPGGNGPVRRTSYFRAVDRLGAAQDALADHGNISAPCFQDIAAIAARRSHVFRGGSDAFSVFDVATSENFENGIGSTDPISALSADPVAGAAAQAAADRRFGAGQTIGKDFARNPLGLTAESVLGGSTIYINPALIGGSLQTNEALLLHEAFHSLGFDDADLQTALGFRFDPTNTKEITDRLRTDCYRQ